MKDEVNIIFLNCLVFWDCYQVFVTLVRSIGSEGCRRTSDRSTYVSRYPKDPSMVHYAQTTIDGRNRHLGTIYEM
jgi:hypothetical protein